MHVCRVFGGAVWYNMAMGQYRPANKIVRSTSQQRLFYSFGGCSPGVQSFDTQPYKTARIYLNIVCVTHAPGTPGRYSCSRLAQTK